MSKCKMCNHYQTTYCNRWCDHGEMFEQRPITNSDHEQEQSKWISVKERLPESRKDVLVVALWHERWQTMLGWHSDQEEKWRIITPHGEREAGGVTHWMPLPEPPKEE